MGFFYDEDTALVPQANTSFTKGARTNIRENLKSVWKAFGKSEMMTSEMSNKTEEYGNAVQILHNAGHTDFVNPFDAKFDPFMGTGFDNKTGYVSTETRSIKELEENFWLEVAEAKKNDDNLNYKLIEGGVDNQENFHKTISKKALTAWKEYAEISERATLSGKIIGGFGGMAARAMTDPPMVAAAFASFGYSVPATFTAAALRVAYMEAIIGGVAETMIQFKAQPYRKELGFEDAGWETGAKNVFMVAGASAVLSPVLLGVFKAFGQGIKFGKKHLLKMPTEDLQKIHKEMGDLNPKYKDKTLNDIEIPKKDNPFPDNAAGRTEHRERLNAAVKSVNENTALDLPPAKNHIVKDNLQPPANIKPGEFTEIFDVNGNIIKTQVVKVSKSGNSIKVKLADGTERIISLDPKSGAYQNIRNPNYVIRYGAGNNTQGKSLLQLTKKQINDTREILIKRKKHFEDKGITNQGAYRDIVQDLNALDFTVNKAITDINSPRIEKATFGKNETKLAEDLNNVKDFDVPNEAAYRNQASVAEGEIFTDGSPLAIKTSVDAGAAAKTVPTGKPSAKTQALSIASQKTDAQPSSSVLATAQSKPPLIRGSTISSVGDFSFRSIGSSRQKSRIYHISNDYNEIYNTLSKKMDSVKKELQPIATKYNGDLKARVKTHKKLKEKFVAKAHLQPQNVSDYLGARISLDTITQAKLVAEELNKTFKLIARDDFLNDIGRTLTKNTEYRRIHLQALTKDGFSFELQISLKELDPLVDISHELYTKIVYQADNLSPTVKAKLLKQQVKAEADMKNKYFEIKDKEFSRLNPTNDIDVPIVVGTRMDEATGEKVPLTKTARELFEEEAKDKTMMKRLEQCMGW